MKVNKITNLKNYGVIFDVGYPIRFYFKKDGSFDGIEVVVENASDRDHLLIKELCLKLARALKITHYYEVEKSKDFAHKEG